MRKIPCKYENPIDNILISICEYTCPFAHALGLTPNILTTISLLFCGFAIFYLLKSRFYLAAFLFLISYYFDCMDGHFARKYKQTSKFGDYYDHIADFTKIVSVLYTLFYINSTKFWNYIPYIILLFGLSAVHLGCQEVYYDKDKSNGESPTLHLLKPLCPISKNKYVDYALQFTKYFGVGTQQIGIAIMILLYSKDTTYLYNRIVTSIK